MSNPVSDKLVVGKVVFSPGATAIPPNETYLRSRIEAVERELTAEKQRSERLEKALRGLIAATDSTDMMTGQSYGLVPLREIESARAALGDSNG